MSAPSGDERMKISSLLQDAVLPAVSPRRKKKDKQIPDSRTAYEEAYVTSDTSLEEPVSRPLFSRRNITVRDRIELQRPTRPPEGYCPWDLYGMSASEREESYLTDDFIRESLDALRQEDNGDVPLPPRPDTTRKMAEEKSVARERSPMQEFSALSLPADNDGEPGAKRKRGPLHESPVRKRKRAAI